MCTYVYYTNASVWGMVIEMDKEKENPLRVFLTGPIGLICLMGLILCVFGFVWIFAFGFPKLAAMMSGSIP